MRFRLTLGIALLAAAVAGCCPGSMMKGGIANNGMHPRSNAMHPVDSDGDGVPDNVDRCPNSPSGCAVDVWGCPLDRDGDGVCDTFDKCQNTERGASVNRDGCSAEQLAAMAPPAPAPAPPPSPTRAERAEHELRTKGAIRLEDVYFETGSARLTKESSEPLDAAGSALAKYPALRLEVGGHTDASGAAAYNMRLSKARAESVRTYLLKHFKLDPKHLKAKGYGETQAGKGTSREELREDRRVELKVLNPQALPKNVEIKD